MSQSDSPYTYREEVSYASEDGPFWLAQENPDGSARTEAQALSLIDDWFGPADEPWIASAVSGDVTETEHGLRFDKSADGSVAFWEVDVP